MAVSEIEKNRRRWEENPKGLAFAAYADALRKAGEAEQALEVLQAGLEYHPDYIPANIVRGRCHLDLGEDAAAEAAFGRVLALDPENVIALKALADVTERGQRWHEATQWLNALLAIDRGNDAAREQMTRIQIAQQDAELAAAQAVTDAEIAAQVAEANAVAAAEAEREAGDREAADAAAAVRAVVDGTPLELEQSQPDAWVPDHVDRVDEPAIVAEDVTPLAGIEPTSFQAESSTVTAAPLDGFVTEEAAASALLLSASSAAGEFAVEDAADGFRAALPDGRLVPTDAAASASSWADVGKGEYVPALFADGEAAPASDAPAATTSPLDGLVLERSSDEPLVSALVEAEAVSGLETTTEALSVEAVSESVVPAMADEPTPLGSVEDAAAATPPSWAEFESAGEAMVSAEPTADAVAHALVETVPATTETPVDVVDVVDVVETEPVVGEVLVDTAAESLVLPDLEAGADEMVEPAAVEAVAPSIEPEPAATIEPVRVPGVVQALALAPHEVEAADRAARELIEAELAASHERPLRDVLADAPVADPAVVALLAAPVAPAVSDELELPATPVRLLEAEPVAEAPPVADEVPVVEAVPVLAEAQVVEEAPVVEEPPVAETASMAPMEPAPAAAPLATFIADEPDDESAAVPPGFSTPLLVTAAMATLYAQQGHLHEALATYKSLETREPGRHAAAIADLEVRIAAALPARPVFAARVSGGQPVRDFFQSLVRTVPPALVDAVAPAAGNGAALRKADDTVSLGRLFGEESASTAVPLGVAARTPSFDEFYGAAATAKEQGGREDIEQFHAWLQGLKS